MVSERSLAVLRVIVQDYVASREPVGSKAIVERHAFGVSAATIRNDMALLEEEELIAAPHTSSGRVPTDKGYRVFVDQLADAAPAHRRAAPGDRDVPRRVRRPRRRARPHRPRCSSQLTSQVALVQYPSFGSARVRHVELVHARRRPLLMTSLITDTGRVEQRLRRASTSPSTTTSSPSCASELNADARRARARAMPPARLAERRRRRSARHAAELRRPTIAATLGEQVAREPPGPARHGRAPPTSRAPRATSRQHLPACSRRSRSRSRCSSCSARWRPTSTASRSSIGRENAAFGLGETSVARRAATRRPAAASRASACSGPTRMDYSNNMAAVRAVARYLSRLLGETDSR